METKECVFCNMTKEEISARNEHGIAFLDKNPIAAGHTLIASLKHFETMDDIDSETLADLMRLAKTVAADLKMSLKCDGINILHASGHAAQQSVDHLTSRPPRPEGKMPSAFWSPAGDSWFAGRRSNI